MKRPNPDELLARLQQQENQATRGKLRIYFGSSAGVGKTFAMLEAAHAIQQEGQTVVVGWIETHGRAETERLLDNLQQLPAQAIPYQGNALREFDLDAALARKPDLLLVDEFAHSNVPGCRHPKRWQDIEELLHNGINVWTTLNVQHLDSLNDVISGITGIRVLETVPDTVFNQADEVVLIDITAEELLKRLHAGKVYLPEQAQRAAKHFFRKGNLIALREIALRRTANRLEKDVLTYKQTQSITSPWKTEDAILACINEDSTTAEQIIRYTTRLAGQMNIDWHVIYIETAALQRLPTPQREQILSQLKQAEQLGATTAILTSENVRQSIVEYAHLHNLTTVVIGHSRQTYSQIWKPSISQQLAQLSPTLDLLQVGASATARHSHPLAPVSPPEEQKTFSYATLKSIGWAILASALTTLITMTLLERFGLDLANLVMLHLLSVVLVAFKLGRRPAITATLCNVAAFDFFLVPPRFTFAVSDVQFLLTFAVMLVVGLTISQLTAGLRFQARVASLREKRANTLFELARDLSGALKAEQVVALSTRVIQQAFGEQVALLLPDRHDTLRPAAPTALIGLDMGIAQWAFNQNRQAGFATDTLPANPFRYIPLRAPVCTRGILAIRPKQQHWLLIPEQLRQLETFASVIAIALERVHFLEVAQEMLIHVESERLRNSLLSALSHDLRTPLTILVGLAESLLLMPSTPPQQQDIIQAMSQTALRMANLVNNLLDMVRIEEGQIKLHYELQALEEIIGTAIQNTRALLGSRSVQVNLAPDFPLVPCDAILLERVLVNLLENAAKYTPPTTRVEIQARCVDDQVEISVADDGPGLPKGQEEAMFEKFARGVTESSTVGVGLGLTICRAIIQAHHGKIIASNRPQGGALFRFTLPLQEIPNDDWRDPHDFAG